MSERNPFTDEPIPDSYSVNMTKYKPLNFNRTAYSDQDWEEILKVTIPRKNKRTDNE